jgi:hypothetical protein
VLAGRRPLTRRTALTSGAVGLLLVAGCDLDDADSAPRSGSSTDTPTPAADPDAALVDSALDEMRSLWALVDDLGDAYPRLARSMHQLRRMHTAHIEALDGELPSHPGGATVSTVPSQPISTVRRAETRLQRNLVDSAMAAQSGTLARLLASMSAAISQQLATLPKAAA